MLSVILVQFSLILLYFTFFTLQKKLLQLNLHVADSQLFAEAVPDMQI